MLLSMTAALADGTHTVTITPATGDTATHSYGAYQIFSGSTSGDTVENVTWGAALNTTTKQAAFIAALKTLGSSFDGLSSTSTAAQVAGAISTYASGHDSDNGKLLAAKIGAFIATEANAITTTATSSGSFTGLAEGYYFIKDMNNPDDANPDNDAYGASTRFILDVVEDLTITAKASVPSVEKKVDDKVDSSNTEDGISWRDDADYDVGDIVPYKIIGTVSSTIGDYTKYAYEFHDSMSAGLTYFADSTRVTKVYMFDSKAAADAATDGTGGTDVTTHFTITGSGQTLDVVANDTNGLKDITGVTGSSAFVVYYYAQVNDNATMGSTGNANEVYIEFSNNPNAGGDGEKGKTPKDTAIVFVYKVVVDKVEKDTNAQDPTATKPLTGAEFALFKKYTTANATAAGKSAATMPAAGITAAQWALDDGYIWVAVAGPVKSAVDGIADSRFTFNHIDDGDYMLVETQTPAGYNTIDPQKFSVVANHVNGTLDSLSGNPETGAVITMTADKTPGSVSTAVLNNSGATLPSTGGIGTTLFYVGGGILVLAAVILLVTKRRMNAND